MTAYLRKMNAPVRRRKLISKAIQIHNAGFERFLCRLDNMTPNQARIAVILGSLGMWAGLIALWAILHVA